MAKYGRKKIDSVCISTLIAHQIWQASCYSGIPMSYSYLCQGV